MNRGDAAAYSVRRILSFLWRLCFFFLLVAFVITSCMILFLEHMTAAMGLTSLPQEATREAAKLTFGNVVLLSLLMTLADGLRRRFMVQRPVRRIAHAAEKVVKGHLETRIEPFHSIGVEEGFNDIIGYFNKMVEELSGMETLRTDFIANVSHELKTPLAAIGNYGALLQQQGLPEEKRREYAAAVAHASRRLANLITNILKLNKLEHQQIHPMDETFLLGEQLCACLLEFEDAWEGKHIGMVTDIDDGIYVESDAELLSLVWRNLFSNAVKFTPEGGQVAVTLKADGGAAVVCVADTGCGISREAGGHIFEKFYQGDTSHAAQGNGLGLALVKRVIDMISGDISVESESGKGSRFTVRIRRASDEGLEKH